MTGHFRGLVGFETRPGATGGHSGAVPPQMTACAPPNGNCAPPSEDCAPKKLTGSKLPECKSTPKLVFFVDWHRISWRFWDEDRFFFWSTCFRPKKPLKFPISAGKFLWIFAPHLVHLIQTGINFSCSRAPLEFTQNKLLVPPPNLFLPPQSRYPGAGPVRDQRLDLRDQDQGLQNVSSRTSSRPGASQAVGQGGNAPPIFVFAPPPPIFFLAPPRYLRFRPEKAFGFRRRPFFFFFFWRSPAFWSENLWFRRKPLLPDFNFAPPISRSWRRPCSRQRTSSRTPSLFVNCKLNSYVYKQ